MKITVYFFLFTHNYLQLIYSLVYKFTNTSNCIINCFVLSLNQESFKVKTEHKTELIDFDLQGKNSVAK